MTIFLKIESEFTKFEPVLLTKNDVRNTIY